MEFWANFLFILFLVTFSFDFFIMRIIIKSRAMKKNEPHLIHTMKIVTVLNISIFAFIALNSLIFSIILYSGAYFFLFLLSSACLVPSIDIYYEDKKRGFGAIFAQMYSCPKPVLKSSLIEFLKTKRIDFVIIDENHLYLPGNNVTITFIGIGTFLFNRPRHKLSGYFIGDYPGPNKEWIDDFIKDLNRTRFWKGLPGG